MRARPQLIYDFLSRRGHFAFDKVAHAYARTVTRKKRQAWCRTGEIPAAFFHYLAKRGCFPQAHTPYRKSERTTDQLILILTSELATNPNARFWRSQILEDAYPIADLVDRQLATRDLEKPMGSRRCRRWSSHSGALHPLERAAGRFMR